MIDYKYLLQDTNAYKIVKNDCEQAKLSHAYLIINPDQKNLVNYLKEFAKLIVCEEKKGCGECRNCKLIEKNSHSDVLFFPENGETVLTNDIVKLIDESFYKPIEGDKKVFVVYLAHTMNAQAQNKLLKTLEEPPKGVHILLGATNEFSLLPTIKSRVKKLEISGFSNKKLIDCLSKECSNLTLLERAVKMGDGTITKALSLYGDENFLETSNLVEELLSNMKSSREVLEYSQKVLALKGDLDEFLSILELYFRDLLMHYCGKDQLINNTQILDSAVLENGYNASSIILAISKIEEARKRRNFNANETMLVEWLLFQILEGKHKWQK